MRFSFTIGTLGVANTDNIPNPGDAHDVLTALKAAAFGWTNVFVNLMAMDYGTDSGSCTISNGVCDMGQSAINGAVSLHAFWAVPYSSIEVTPMIGGNDDQVEVFSLTDVATLSAFAVKNGLGGIHFWSLDRDMDCANTGPSGAASDTCNNYGQAGTLGFSKAFIAAL